jgi:hypothetical protein
MFPESTMRVLLLSTLLFACTSEKQRAGAYVNRSDSAGFFDTDREINPTAEEVTSRRIGILREWAEHLRRSSGSWPHTLQEILPPNPQDPNFQPHDRWWLDAWGRQFAYITSTDRCELRSSGPDGTMNTKDDIVLSWSVQ